MKPVAMSSSICRSQTYVRRCANRFLLKMAAKEWILLLIPLAAMRLMRRYARLPGEGAWSSSVLPLVAYPALRRITYWSRTSKLAELQVSDYRKRTPDLMRRCMREVFSWYEAGKLRIAVAVTYPLDSFAQALQDVVDRRANGRIVLVPNV